MGKNSKRFRTALKRAMSYKAHPPEEAVAERLNHPDDIDEDIRRLEDNLGFHYRDDEGSGLNDKLSANLRLKANLRRDKEYEDSYEGRWPVD